MTKKQLDQKDDLNLVDLVSKLWHGKKAIIWITTVCIIFGLALALITPNSFEARSVFLTQVSNEKGGGSIGGLASLAGINLGGVMANSSGISPVLYPKIFNSYSFRRSILEAPLHYRGNNLTYREYLKQRPKSISSIIIKYTIGLPGQILSLFKSEKSNSQNSSETPYGLKLTEEEFLLIRGMKGVITLSYNELDGYNTLTVQDSDPEIAAQLASWLEKELQEKIIKYKIKSSQELYDFTLSEFKVKQQEVYALQDQLAEFTEQNQNVSSAFVQNELRRLQAEYDMLNTVYTELARQKEEVALQLKKDTPIFSIIDPVSIPNRKSAPKRSLMLIISAFLGFFLSIGYVLVREPILTIFQKVKKG